MNASWPTARRWLATFPFFQRGSEGLFRALCRRHLARLDSCDPARAQLATLLGLIHRAQGSPFGRAHDFRRVRTADDFRRLAPLRTRAELQRLATPPTWQTADRIGRAALSTALALVAEARPRVRLFGGTLLLLGDDVALTDDPRRVLPALARPFANRRGRVSCLIGTADRLARFLDVCRPDDRASPAAALVVPTEGISLERLRKGLGPEVLYLELQLRPHVAVAVDDPRHGLSRLLMTHGVYYEFVAAEDRHLPAPPRVGFDALEPGATYELVVTAAGGWWACRTGSGLRLERRNPPLVRWTALPPLAQSAARVEVDNARASAHPFSRAASLAPATSNGHENRAAPAARF